MSNLFNKRTLPKPDSTLTEQDEEFLSSPPRPKPTLTKEDKEFLKSSLKEQCKYFGIPIQSVEIKKGGGKGQWEYGNKKQISVESAALAYFKKNGCSGVNAEGGPILILLHASCLEYLIEAHHYSDYDGDPVDDATKFFESQCHYNVVRVERMLSEISQTSEVRIQKNLKTILKINLVKSIYKSMEFSELMKIYKALGSQNLHDIAKIFLTDSYKFRKGWPDLCLVGADGLKFVEVKTTDKIHESQYKTFKEIILKLGFPLEIMKVIPLEKAKGLISKNTGKPNLTDSKKNRKFAEDRKDKLLQTKKYCDDELKKMWEPDNDDIFSRNYSAPPAQFLELSIQFRREKNYEQEVKYCELYIDAIENFYWEKGYEVSADVRKGPTYKTIVNRWEDARILLEKNKTTL